MNIADCYRLLGLRTGASYEEVKAAYRRLARQLHPDINPNDQKSKEKFIQVNEAYRFLLSVVSPIGIREAAVSPKSSTSPQPASPPPPKVTISRKPQPPKSQSASSSADLSFIDQQLKQASYEQLQILLRSKRFPRSIALVEGLAQRLPTDPEIRQWQAIAYQRWGHHLIQEKQFDKARLYLKKALRTDPHNRSLWGEVERDFRRLEQLTYQKK
ncbi:MAG: DnaJ domain-containing protein [Leptolyngbyaceae cyanobacterium CSU_1_3]|nr:DnaJ domain-containing protein [Leptolyngbyaceae cyanobacterium CSU_1_3]